MKLFYIGKDGGKDSTVTGFWLIEIKSLFSIALLRFDNGSRDQFHSHAFNCISWVLHGKLREEIFPPERYDNIYKAGIRPVITKRSTFHRVLSMGTTWVLTFRGPWAKQWMEYDPNTHMSSVLTHGRKVVEEWDESTI